jgi:hypothetical protein
MTCSPFKNSLLITKKKRTKNLYDWPTVVESTYSGRKTDKKKIVYPGVMSDIKGQVQKNGRSVLNATDGGASTVLPLKELSPLIATFAEREPLEDALCTLTTTVRTTDQWPWSYF